jgi:hypothetical protein
LKIIRKSHKYLAHADKKYAENPQTLYQEADLQSADLETLLSVAGDILNSLLAALCDRCVSTNHFNCDDYRHLLYVANSGIEKSK